MTSSRLNAKARAYMREHPEVNYTVTDYFSMQLAADVFFGPKDTFFGQYERDGRLILNAKLSF